MTELSRDPINQPPANPEEDYNLIEQALLQNPRGRWFLEEYITRNRPEDTKKLLNAIQRIENNLVKSDAPLQNDLDPIRMSIIEMSKAIAKTREEIKSIKPEDDADNQITSATEELSTIVEATESATNTILEAAEEIQEAAWVLREAGAEDTHCSKIDDKTTDIYTACSFQDITGQRTTKVVQALSYIENRVNSMIDIWGLNETSETFTPKEDASDSRPDAHLLNGPAKQGKEIHQNTVDDMMDADNISFDAIDINPVDEINIDDISFDEIETSKMPLTAEASELNDLESVMPDPTALETAIDETTLTPPDDEQENSSLAEITDPDPRTEAFAEETNTLNDPINNEIDIKAEPALTAPEVSEEQANIAAANPLEDKLAISENLDIEIKDVAETNEPNIDLINLDTLASEEPATQMAQAPQVAPEQEENQISDAGKLETIDELDHETLTQAQKDALLS